jgi:1-acyl-sn-glycerol-3-phosphate acyltransferase
MDTIARWFFRSLARLLARLFLRLEIIGWENLPPGGPLIVISNHFGVFEAPLLMALLPYKSKMTFMAATELQESRILRYLMRLYDIIPIWRGQPDREALRRAIDWLDAGGVLGIMPEGSVDAGLQAEIQATGRQTGLRGGPSARASAQVLPPRPGAAYLAVRSGAPVLPVAFLGGQHILDNLRQWRRSNLTMTIGPVFGPLLVDDSLPKPARREQLDAYGHEMMRQVALLLPPENRGPYA